MYSLNDFPVVSSFLPNAGHNKNHNYLTRVIYSGGTEIEENE